MNDCLSLNATACRVTQLAREKEEKRALERRRHLVYLIAAFLREQGYSNTAESLLKEAQLCRDVHVCDNIDLETIILEYADYYYAKYNRYPKFCKKMEAAGNVAQNTCGKKERVSKTFNLRQEDGRAVGDECNNTGKSKIAQKHVVASNELNLGITVTPIFPAESGDRAAIVQPIAMSDEAFTDNNERILKPIGDLYPPGSELKEIADVISRVLTDLAKHYAPTIIFIDEIDWTTTKNADYASSSSEPARRFRAELLARLDGLLSMEYMNVTLLAATNVPWNIDVALLRRLEKRIFVDLPDEASRLEILQFYVHQDLHESSEMSDLVKETAGYSCADLKLLCKEAWMNQLRPVWARLESKAVSVNDIQNDSLINAMSHIALAKNNVKPIAKHMSDQYAKWHKEFGSFG
ncbi:katanin p60 ATPase-containing subunit A-like 2 isoform X2 [Harpegnathos saltator]|uniref:katanin p60 ATPase-containing subunit A-like 2 isoform X2 n=1 Tax=Harpegnathos saltator TaxID=610380 RepID=UPI000DBEED23|nr:katanin p60 ATPase-containing subunit A-like 2 isoform X2 [Harpegnathos saltator]